LLALSACDRANPPGAATPGDTTASPSGSVAHARTATTPGNTARQASGDRAEGHGAEHPPDTLSHASPAWDDGGARVEVAKGDVVDGAALRKRTRERIKADASPVTVLQGGSARELGQRVCEAAVPQRPKDTPILLKPNMGGFDWFKSGADNGIKGRTTDPEFVRGVIHCLKGRGHTRITVAEGWGATHADWERLIEVSGYAAMTKAEGVRLVAMDDDGVFDVEGDKPGKPLAIRGMEASHVPTLLMPKVLAEHLDKGLFISLPKMKAHRYAVFSMGIKGAQGTVMLSDKAPAFRQKGRMHRELDMRKAKDPGERAAYVRSLELFADRIADVLEVEAPDVVLAEGAPIMHGDGFQKLVPRDGAYAVGGTNFIAVDRVGAELMGFWENRDLEKELPGYRSSPLLVRAAKHFGVDLAVRPALRGDGATALALYAPYTLYGMAGFSLTGTMPPAASPGTPATPTTPAGAPTAPPPATPGDKPTLEARYLAGDLTIDASDKAAWNEAGVTRAEFNTDTRGDATDVRTKVRARWNERALYLRFDLENAGLNVDRGRPIDVEREGLYNEDCVEFFLAPKPTEPNKYYEVELGPFGHFFDLAVEKGTRLKSDIQWSSGLTVKTRQDVPARTAIIEAKLTAKEIVSALQTDARLPLGLFRMEGKAPRKYLAWSPARTEKPNFHLPHAFGTLQLTR
jgi:uncharacterized protein (DUF362 family)